MQENIPFSQTGMYKTNSIKKMVAIILSVDSIFGEKFV